MRVRRGRLGARLLGNRALAFALVMAFCMPVLAQTPTQPHPARIASLNLCLDQFLIAFAPPERIAALSPFARNPALSQGAKAAQTLPVLSAQAENLLTLHADLVVSDAYAKPATRALLTRLGVRVEVFPHADSVAETMRQITLFGALTGQEVAAQARLAAIETALERLRKAPKRRLVALSRRGWVAPAASLLGDLMAQAGAQNGAETLFFRANGTVPLESLIANAPDALVVSQADLMVEDQGTALLAHPALVRLFPPERRIVLPEPLTLCGGPRLDEAIDLFAQQLMRIPPRSSP